MSVSDTDAQKVSGSGNDTVTGTVTVPTDGGAVFGGIGTHNGGGCAAGGDITGDAVGAVAVESTFFNVNGGLTNTVGSQDGTFSISGTTSSSAVYSVGVAYAP
jgi:hypothetical protein